MVIITKEKPLAANIRLASEQGSLEKGSQQQIPKGVRVSAEKEPQEIMKYVSLTIIPKHKRKTSTLMANKVSIIGIPFRRKQ